MNMQPSFDPALLPAWVSAIATSLGAVVAVIAILLTSRQIQLTAVQMRQSSKQAASDSEDRTRPYLSIDIIPGLQGPGIFDIIIENQGASTATDIRMSLVGSEWGPQSDDDKIVGPALKKFFEDPIELPPGARKRLIWRISDTEESKSRGAMGAPPSGEIKATYTRENTTNPTDDRYETLCKYDLNLWPLLTPVPTTGATSSPEADDYRAALKNINHALRAIALHAGELHR